MRPLLSLFLSVGAKTADPVLLQRVSWLPPLPVGSSSDAYLGYRFERLAGEVDLVVDEFDYIAVFEVSAGGVVMFGAPPTMWPVLEAAIASVADEQQPHMIYSYVHVGHVGDSDLFVDAEIDPDAAALIPVAASDALRLPMSSFKDRLDLEVGGVDITLEHFGPDHSLSMVFVSISEKPVLMVLVIIDGGHVPGCGFNYADYISYKLTAIDRVFAADFNLHVVGHEGFAYSKDELSVVADHAFYARDTLCGSFSALIPSDYTDWQRHEYAVVVTTMDSKRNLGNTVDRRRERIVASWQNHHRAVAAFNRSHHEAFSSRGSMRPAAYNARNTHD